MMIDPGFQNSKDGIFNLKLRLFFVESLRVLTMQLLKWYCDAALLLLGQITVRELIICSASLLMLCLSGSTALLRSMKPIMVRYIYIRGDSHWMPILYASDQNVRSPPIMKEANINCPVVLFSGLHYLWDGGSSTSLGGGFWKHRGAKSFESIA